MHRKSMNMKPNQLPGLLRALLIVVVLSFLALWRVWQVGQVLGVAMFSSKWTIILAGLGGSALLMGSIFALTWNNKACHWADSFFDQNIPDTRIVKAIAILFFILMIVFYSWLLLFSPLVDFFILLNNNYLAWWLFLIFGMMAAFFLKTTRKGLSFGLSLLSALVGEAFSYKIVCLLMRVSSNPFAYNWEENDLPPKS